jgi:poly-beta-1,6-N-acetyl-D-glucosamine synthase
MSYYLMAWITVALLSLVLLSGNFLLATLLNLLRGKGATASRAVESVTIIIPAYNEELNIGPKLDSLRQALQGVDIDVEILVGSDGSKDRTVEIAKSRLEESGLRNWRVFDFENEGKCNTINKLVKAARGELIISTDADILVPPGAMGMIIGAFQSNAKLGCLSCVPALSSDNAGTQKRYWRVEDRIRQAESRLGKLIVVTGWLYAFRREEFQEIPRGVMADDLWVPLTFLLQGFDSLQHDGLIVSSEGTDEVTETLRRKRVIIGGMDVVRRLGAQLFAQPALLLLVVAHKVNRWAIPCWLTLLALATVGIYPYLLLVYLLLFFLILFRFGTKKLRNFGYAFLSPILAFGAVAFKKDFARWEPTRKQSES